MYPYKLVSPNKLFSKLSPLRLDIYIKNKYIITTTRFPHPQGGSGNNISQQKIFHINSSQNHHHYEPIYTKIQLYYYQNSLPTPTNKKTNLSYPYKKIPPYI